MDIFSFFYFLLFFFLSKVSPALLNFAIYFSFLLPQEKHFSSENTTFFFPPSLPANCLALSRQVSRINKLTFGEITKVQVGCLRGESLNIRWSIRLQKVSIKVTVQAAFACPGKVCSSCQCHPGSCVHPGQGGLVPPGSFCTAGAAAAAVVLAPANGSSSFSGRNSTVTALNTGQETDPLSVPPRLEWRSLTWTYLPSGFTQCSSLPQPEGEQNQAHNLPHYCPKSCSLLLVIIF